MFVHPRTVIRRTVTVMVTSAAVVGAVLCGPAQASPDGPSDRTWPANVRWYSQGPGVGCLQRALNVVHAVVPRYVPYTLRVDGYFGNYTDRDVRAFQRWYGLTVDGIVGPKTRTAIANTLTYPSFASPTTTRLRSTDCVRTGGAY